MDTIVKVLVRNFECHNIVEIEERYPLTPTNIFYRFVLRRFSFTIEPTDNGSTFRARIKILTGPIGQRLNKKEFDAVRQHMKEEGENLKRLMEES